MLRFEWVNDRQLDAKLSPALLKLFRKSVRAATDALANKTTPVRISPSMRHLFHSENQRNPWTILGSILFKLLKTVSGRTFAG